MPLESAFHQLFCPKCSENKVGVFFSEHSVDLSIWNNVI